MGQVKVARGNVLYWAIYAAQLMLHEGHNSMVLLPLTPEDLFLPQTALFLHEPLDFVRKASIAVFTESRPG